MEIIQHKRTEVFPLGKHFSSFYTNHNFIVFDIETTGLNAKYEKVILIGLMYIENGQPVIEQYFCHHRKNEPLLLSQFADKIRQYDLLISYNGNSFDIPFLNQRFLQNGIPYQIDKYKSLDLLRFARKYKQALNLTDCTLKSVEKSLGIHRNDTISGKESVELYAAYEKTPSSLLKNKILLHNYEDIYYLGHCLQILDSVSFDEALQQMPIILKPIPDQTWYIANLSIKTNILQVEGYYTGSPLEDSIIHDKGYSFQYAQLSHEYQLRIPLYAGMLSTKMKCLYVDTHDFSFSYNKQASDLILKENILPVKISNVLKTEEIVNLVNQLIKYIFLK